MNKENFNRGSGFCQCLFYMLKEVMWMANKIFNTRVKNKRDTEANWKRKNPVLLDGEIIIVTTTSGDTRFKVGDGKKTYNQLPFQDQKTRDLIPSVDSSLSSTSTNPVQNKIIKSELDKKAERDVVNTTTNGLMSVADKKKLDGIADGANKITVDTSLSSTSTNPVQNKIIKSELDTKFNKSGGTINGSVWVNSDSNESVAISAGRVVADDWVNATSGVTIGKGSSAGAFVSLRCDRSSDTTESLKIFKDLYVEDGGLAHVTIADPIDSDHATTKNYVDTGLSGKLDKSGGTLTGNLSGKYITGTWLQTTEATDLGRTPGKIAVLDESGWVYSRTPLELLADIGATTVNEILGLVYPVGSIYMSINNVSPVTLFGGKWVQIQGRFLLGASDVYKANTTGGEATHTLTANEMPEHAHYMASGNSGGDSTWTPDAGSYLVDSVTTDKTTYWAQIGMNNAGGSAAHNNMPPYLVVYMWRRLA